MTTLHRDLTGSNLHSPKAHGSSHSNGESDETNIAGLSGKVADKQDPLFTHSDLVPDSLPSLMQTLYQLDCRLNTIENRLSLLWYEAKRANTNFDLGETF